MCKFLITDSDTYLSNIVIQNYKVCEQEKVARYVRRVEQVNQHSGVLSLDKSAKLRPHRMLFLPTNLVNTESHFRGKAFCHAFNEADMTTRKHVIEMMECGITWQGITGMVQSEQAFNKPLPSGNDIFPENIRGAMAHAENFSRNLLSTANKGHSIQTNNLYQLLEHLDATGREYADAPSLKKADVKPRLNQAHANLNQHYGSYINSVIGTPVPQKKHHIFHSPRNFRNHYRKQPNFSLPQSHVGRLVMRRAKTFTRIDRGLITLNLGMAALSVYGCYQDEGDWKKQAFLEAGGLAGGSAGAFVVGTAAKIALGFGRVALFSTPTGWGLLIVGATVSMGASAIFKSYAEKIWDNF